MLTMLLAYDAAGNITETLDYMVARDETGKVVGIIDFEAHERAGGKMRDIWTANAVGSGTWPEWIGPQAHAFRVERDATGRIAAIVHKTSGHRREREAIEDAIAARIRESAGQKADIRDIVGGPTAPLVLDEDGRTRSRDIRPTPAHLPIVGSTKASSSLKLRSQRG